MLNAVQHDAWVLGNYELDFGLPRLRQLVSMARVPIINGNFRIADIPPFPAYRIYEKSGVKIAVIGLNASYLPNWFWGRRMQRLKVEKGSAVVERILPDMMRLQPDMIILALHHSWRDRDERNVNKIRTIATLFPQIDLILGGHTLSRNSGHESRARLVCPGRFTWRETRTHLGDDRSFPTPSRSHRIGASTCGCL